MSAPPRSAPVGQALVEVEMGAPGLVDDQRDARGRARRRRAPRHAPRRRSRSARRASTASASRLRIEGGAQGLGRDAVGDAELGVDLRGDECRPQPREDEPVDDRGVDVALDDDWAAVRRARCELARGMGQGHADGVVPARSSIDQKPAPLSSPGIGRQALSALEGCWLRPNVDPLDAGRNVVEDGRLAEGLDQAGVGARPLVPRDVEATGVSRDICDDRVEVRGFGLVGHAYAPCGGSPPV